MFLIDWIKKKLVLRELRKSKLLKKVILWLEQPGNKRIVVAILFGCSASLRYLDYVAPAEIVEQLKELVNTLPPGMDAGAFVLLAWSIFQG